MPGKRARRHFSQLSEFERPDHRNENCRLVDASCCWPGGSSGVPLEIIGQEATHVRKTGSGATRKSKERGSKDRAARTCMTRSK
ncbi:hypothetical protein TNCV_1375101 [Trichonephila clavipes]|nr:hypothetical protein TNCV_1375101 [Trichonephila clavipes]